MINKKDKLHCRHTLQDSFIMFYFINSFKSIRFVTNSLRVSLTFLLLSLLACTKAESKSPIEMRLLMERDFVVFYIRNIPGASICVSSHLYVGSKEGHAPIFFDVIDAKGKARHWMQGEPHGGTLTRDFIELQSGGVIGGSAYIEFIAHMYALEAGTYSLIANYRMENWKLNAHGLDAVDAMINGEPVDCFVGKVSSNPVQIKITK